MAAPVSAITALYAGKRYFQGPRCQSNKSLKGKTAVITGAVDLAERGVRVLIECRNIERKHWNETLKEIEERSENTEVFFEKLDLASLESVRTFADKILKSEPCLDILAPVVQKLDSAIHQINHYPVEKCLGNQLRYPLDRQLSGG